MPEFDSTIEYLPVVRFPAYKVGNDGSVWTCQKRVGHGHGGGGHYIISDEWQRMNPTPQHHGHLYVTLFPGGRKHAVHRLILEAFVGPCPPGMVGRHFPDRNPANNHIDNIQWGTETENQRDRVGHDTHTRGSRSPNAKVTEEDVHQIRQLSGSMSNSSIAARFGISRAAVWAILTGKNWAHLKPKPSGTSV